MFIRDETLLLFKPRKKNKALLIPQKNFIDFEILLNEP